MGTTVSLSTDWGEVMEKHPTRGKDGKGKVLWMTSPQEGFVERCGSCAFVSCAPTKATTENLRLSRQASTNTRLLCPCLEPAPRAPSAASQVYFEHFFSFSRSVVKLTATPTNGFVTHERRGNYIIVRTTPPLNLRTTQATARGRKG